MRKTSKWKLNILLYFFAVFIICNLINVSNPNELHSYNFVNSSSIQAEQRDCYALCIGIANYPGTVNDLQYCDNDAIDVSNWLQSKFHIPSSNIEVLTDALATKSEIRSKMELIASKMDKDDYFFFFYSGHGDAELVIDKTKDWNIESQHPYPNYHDEYWNKRIVGAEYMRVHFTRIDTEYGYDGVFLGENSERDFYYDLYTGSYDNIWSYWIPTSNIYVNLYSDNSNTDWGFAVDKVQSAHLGERQIVPHDAIDTEFTTSEFDSLLSNMRGTVVTVLDSCYSGAVGMEISGDDRYILTGGTDDEYTLEDGDANNGVFTRKFIDQFNTAADSNGDSVISFEEAFPSIQSSTGYRSSQLGYRHTPNEFDGVEGEVIFSLNAEIIELTVSASKLDITLAHNGLGYGTFNIAFYDRDNEDYHVFNAGLLLPSSSMQQLIYYTPAGFELDAYYVALNTTYQGVHEEDVRSNYFNGIPFSNGDDSDGDTLDDLFEFTHGLNPWNEDSDGDQLLDAWELTHSLDPSISDSDGDGLSDGDELNTYGTDPENYDSDFDKMADGWEIQYSLNPLSVSDGQLDNDGDSLLNFLEYFYRTNPLVSDTDADWLSDYEEVMWYNTDPNDRDSDNDLMGDGIEVKLFTDPLSNVSSPWLYISIIGIISSGFLFIYIVRKSATKKDIKRVEEMKEPHPSPSDVETTVEKIPQSNYGYRSPLPYSSPPPSQRKPNEAEFKMIVQMLLAGKCPSCGGSISKYTFSCNICGRNYREFYNKLFGGK